MMLVPDARRRVTLPASFKAGQPVSIEPLEDGTYRLVPMVAIPENQLWAWRSDVQASVETSLSEYHDGDATTLESQEGKKLLRKLEGK
ncbi:MAG: AbrB/MazE/SpoVT family DNA-binding domain-containing protein [Acidobacteria bacterium]|nr:AbrB/MazE/SpoVT family DNA-binding domain-containing protein [Acidobacteriota bacterium]MBI3489986.1 AbrB/MazE/SpoVT family DNA-binding domain-containing protein [Acidobacteriota bacterium]